MASGTVRYLEDLRAAATVMYFTFDDRIQAHAMTSCVVRKCKPGGYRRLAFSLKGHVLTILATSCASGHPGTATSCQPGRRAPSAEVQVLYVVWGQECFGSLARVCIYSALGEGCRV